MNKNNTVRVRVDENAGVYLKGEIVDVISFNSDYWVEAKGNVKILKSDCTIIETKTINTDTQEKRYYYDHRYFQLFLIKEDEIDSKNGIDISDELKKLWGTKLWGTVEVKIEGKDFELQYEVQLKNEKWEVVNEDFYNFCSDFRRITAIPLSDTPPKAEDTIKGIKYDKVKEKILHVLDARDGKLKETLSLNDDFRKGFLLAEDLVKETFKTWDREIKLVNEIAKDLPSQQPDHIHIPLKNVEGRATFTGKPTQEVIDAVNRMAETAYHKTTEAEDREKEIAEIREKISNQMLFSDGYTIAGGKLVHYLASLEQRLNKLEKK